MNEVCNLMLLFSEERDSDQALFKYDIPISGLTGMPKIVRQTAPTRVTSAFIQLPLLSPENHRRDQAAVSQKSLPALIIPGSAATILNTALPSAPFLTAFAVTPEGIGRSSSVTKEPKSPIQLVVLPSLSGDSVEQSAAPTTTAAELASSVLELTSSNLDSTSVVSMSVLPAISETPVTQFASTGATVSGPLASETSVVVKDEAGAKNELNFMSGIADKFKSERDPSWAPSTTVADVTATLLRVPGSSGWQETDWGNSCTSFADQLKPGVQVTQDEASAAFARFCDQPRNPEEMLSFGSSIKPTSECVADVAPLFANGDRFETVASEPDFRHPESTSDFLSAVTAVTMADTQDFSKADAPISMTSEGSLADAGSAGNKNLLVGFPTPGAGESVAPLLFRTEPEPLATETFTQASSATILTDTMLPPSNTFHYGDCSTAMSANERIVEELNSIDATLQALNTSAASVNTTMEYISPLGSTLQTSTTTVHSLMTPVLSSVEPQPLCPSDVNKDATFVDTRSSGVSLPPPNAESIMAAAGSPMKNVEPTLMQVCTLAGVNTIPSVETVKSEGLVSTPVVSVSTSALQQAPVPSMDQLSAMTMLPESELLRMINPSTFDNV